MRSPQAASDSRIAFKRGRFRFNFLSRDVGLTDTNRSPRVKSSEGSPSNRVDHISALERHHRFCESRRISNDIGAASCTAERYAALRRFLGLVASGRPLSAERPSIGEIDRAEHGARERHHDGVRLHRWTAHEVELVPPTRERRQGDELTVELGLVPEPRDYPQSQERLKSDSD